MNTQISDQEVTRMRMWMAALLVAVVWACAIGTGDARAAMDITSFEAKAVDVDGTSEDARAGAHPYAAFADLWTAQDLPGVGAEDLRRATVDLPPGFVGDPTSASRCRRADLTYGNGVCPPSSQVGMAMYRIAMPGVSEGFAIAVPLYNLEPSRGSAAELGFSVLGVPIHISATMIADDGYRVRTFAQVPDALPTLGAKIVLWGNPADPVHDPQRGAGAQCIGDPLDPASMCFGGGAQSGIEPAPFLSNPTHCGPRLVTTLRADSWQTPGAFDTAEALTDSGPAGCESLDFLPSVALDSYARDADAASGLGVAIRLSENSDPAGRATAHLRDAEVRLPDGLTVNPAAAAGLVACDDDQLGLGTDARVACPAASKIGSAAATTPLLDEVLSGDVYVRTQASMEPESGDMFRIALVLEHQERGVLVKLPGSVRADSATGRLTATFHDNPQMPVSSVSVQLKSGARAPLAAPLTCGSRNAFVHLAAWSGHASTASAPFVTECRDAVAFAPVFAGGAVSSVGGAYSPLVVGIKRAPRQALLSEVDVDLPKGLLAKLRGVELCPDAVAGHGTGGSCPVGSRVGSAIVGAGSGSPFFLRGDVYLTGPYKNAPYGLSVQIHAKAGPFDLGMVKVRQRIQVDPETAQVDVVSDPLPEVVKGVPARLRSVDVDIDRSGFAMNPTSCAAKQMEATLTAIDGETHSTKTPFQASDCQALAFTPRMRMRLVGRGQTGTGGHPAFRTVLSQGGGQAGIGRVRVALPKSVVLDPINTVGDSRVCDYDASLTAECPANTAVGRATAHTPLLNRPLSGPVYLVQGIKFGERGNRIRTTPSLLVKLRGEVAINLRGRTTTTRDNRLLTTFPAVPDAPVSRFDLTIDGGRNGILVVTRTRKGRIDLCRRRQVATVRTDGHNGKRADYRTTVKTPCSSKAHRTARKELRGPSRTRSRPDQGR